MPSDEEFWADFWIFEIKFHKCAVVCAPHEGAWIIGHDADARPPQRA